MLTFHNFCTSDKDVIEAALFISYSYVKQAQLDVKIKLEALRELLLQ